MVKRLKFHTKAFKKRLLVMREEVEQLSEVTEDARKPVELDQSMVGRLSRMDALQEQAMQLATEGRRHAGLQRIDAAMQRIIDGEFGRCVSCGEGIDPKRLEYDPTIPTCIDCAAL